MDKRKKNLFLNAATNKVRVSLYLFSIVSVRVMQVNPFLGNRKAVSVQSGSWWQLLRPHSGTEF